MGGTVGKLLDDVETIKNSVHAIELKLKDFPCKVHEEKFKSINRLWAVVLVILAGLLASVSVSWKNTNEMKKTLSYERVLDKAYKKEGSKSGKN